MFENYKDFISKIFRDLEDLGIKTSNFKIDHIGYQADSRDDYDNLKIELLKNSRLISENMVGERRVGVFKLNTVLNYDKEIFDVVEVFEPRSGQSVVSDWEHIEFLANLSLEEMVNEYHNIEWDKSMIDRKEFPMLILKLPSGLRAKFPRIGVEYEIKRISKN